MYRLKPFGRELCAPIAGPCNARTLTRDTRTLLATPDPAVMHATHRHDGAGSIERHERVTRCRERCGRCKRGLLLVMLDGQCAARARLLLQVSVRNSVPSFGAQTLPELTNARAEAARADAEQICYACVGIIATL